MDYIIIDKIKKEKKDASVYRKLSYAYHTHPVVRGSQL